MLPLKDNIPTRRQPILTIAIIVICVVVYFGFQHGGLNGPTTENTYQYAFIPYELQHPDQQCDPTACGAEIHPGWPAVWLTLLFAMFMHGGLLHLGGNMLFLWIFGNNIEDSMSRWRFAAFYLLGGLVATLVHAVASFSQGTAESTIPTLGASGAIAAVLGGYAVLYPRARVVTLIFIIIFVTVIELPALVVLGAWFLLQLLGGSQPTGDGVAYFAHIGGFVFGLLFIRIFANRVHDDYDRASRIPVY